MVIPNVFTPNMDGVNDLFDISKSYIKTMKSEIYNRWGQPLYKSEDTILNWDGYNNSGNQAPEGVYFYIIQIVMLNDEKRTLSGQIQLIR